ncbi:cytochrome c oxidase, subunit II [Candidatus Koribacter versatilis Ellin345]|uniref:Cytochrome c oxidase subunit 2 n=1 Tax=Koribacter versatilis (strain Ellin345) TaxID=204669 RepID=Q1IMA3_KORVE|nr:cytochrome c oxidase subunit II [Candidatus Koribacter versatilis]ABF41997.1 cytochrome c oxidase, subunit II [Candidatus Koribacter versatilis Ellin345]
MWEQLPLFPAQASKIAPQVDILFFFLCAVTVFFSLLIAFVVVFFAVKYRKEKHPHAEQIEGSVPLELTWTLIPLAIAMVMFVWGASIFFIESRPPRDAMEIYAVGKQWMWKFQHVEGVREINTLHVPMGRDVKMIMSSQDVIHDFFVPAFRVKADVLPGRYSVVWFHPTKAGTYHLFCAQYCGTQHSGMIGEVIVMEPDEYEAWLSGGGAEGSLSGTGQKLFQQYGCATCHRSDTQGRGPNLTGVFGKPVLLDDGRTVVADENYVRESILNPGAKVVSGFKPIMPTFQGQLSEEQLIALVEYVKSLAGPNPNSAPVTNRPVVPNNATQQ